MKKKYRKLDRIEPEDKKWVSKRERRVDRSKPLEKTWVSQRDMRMDRIFYEIANQLGNSAERDVDLALRHAREKGELPPWIIDWTWSQKFSESDLSGIDFSIHTDVGPIYLNIKSSRFMAESFEKKHAGQPIRTVVVNVLHSIDVTYSRVIEEIAAARVLALQRSKKTMVPSQLV